MPSIKHVIISIFYLDKEIANYKGTYTIIINKALIYIHTHSTFIYTLYISTLIIRYNGIPYNGFLLIWTFLAANQGF